jgi:uncharacterized membrane protein required for colicin V production
VADAVLLLVFGLAFVLGAWRGALRQLLLAAAWLLSFLSAAYLRDVVAKWISPQQSDLSFQYDQMVAFLATFIVLFAVLALIIEITGTRMNVFRRQWMDDWLGGLVAVGIAVLVIGSLMVIFDSYYAGNYPASVELGIVQSIHSGLIGSGIGGALHNSLVPGLLAVGGLLLPSNVVHPG